MNYGRLAIPALAGLLVITVTGFTAFVKLLVGCVAQLVERRSLTGKLSMSYARPAAGE